MIKTAVDNLNWYFSENLNMIITFLHYNTNDSIYIYKLTQQRKRRKHQYKFNEIVIPLRFFWQFYLFWGFSRNKFHKCNK